MKHFVILIIVGLSTILSAQDTMVKPVFKNGEAQIVPEFENSSNWIRHDLWVETSFDTDGDGLLDRMHVSVTRPQETETQSLKLPVVYVTSPYFAGVASDEEGLFWNVKHELGEVAEERTHPEVIRRGIRPVISNSHLKTWVPRGYIVVHSSSPGTGLSHGAPTVGGENESLAPKAVIEWLSGADNGYTTPDGDEKVMAYWSTGNVGMTGTSYNGTLPVAAATTGVEGLKAIIPIAPNTSYYHYYRSHGLVRHPGGYLGEDIDVLYDFIHSGDKSKRPYNNATVRDKEMKENMDRVTGDYNDFWAQRDYLNHMDNFKAALLMSHGFNDWNVMPEHSYRIYDAARKNSVPSMIYYHQNGHGGPPPFSMMNRWFTRFLHGIENGVETEENKSWIVREKDPQDQPTPYPDYPHPEAQSVELHLVPGAPEQGQLSIDSSTEENITETLTDNFSFSGAILAQAENTDHRLIYLSPELKEDLHISGITSLNIRMSCSKPAANLSVWLVSLPWNNKNGALITDNIITRGWADPQNAQSIRSSSPLNPGEFVEFNLTLQPDDQVIPKGQQIALMIFSSDRDFTLWPQPGTEITVDLDNTFLSLPIVGGKAAYLKAIE